ncbi:MAG: Hpt domain-containing protein [Oligoflexus sp.]
MKVHVSPFSTTPEYDSIIASVTQLFLQSLPSRLADFHQALQHSDWSRLAYLAHQMAGAAGSFGFPELGKLAAKIESLLKTQPKPENLELLMAAFDEQCQQALSAKCKK